MCYGMTYFYTSKLITKYIGQKKEYGNFLKCVIVKIPHKTITKEGCRSGPKAGTSSGSTSSKPTSTLPPVETPAPTSTPPRSLQYRDDLEYIFPPLPPEKRNAQ